jgi:hypothetical protein
MVRKELVAGFLAYNMIRGVMAEAARVVAIKPRALSFMRSLHTVRAFEESHLYDPTRIAADLPRLLGLVGKKRLADRLDRYEPRAMKRRPKRHPLLTMPRQATRRLIRRGIIEVLQCSRSLNKVNGVQPQGRTSASMLLPSPAIAEEAEEAGAEQENGGGFGDCAC